MRSEIDYEAVGRRLRTFRMAKGMSQKVLSEKSGVDFSNVSHIERGATKLSLPTLISLANVLEVTPDEILCDSIEATTKTYEKEISNIFVGCTNEERRILLDVARNLKQNLKNRADNII